MGRTFGHGLMQIGDRVRHHYQEQKVSFSLYNELYSRQEGFYTENLCIENSH